VARMRRLPVPLFVLTVVLMASRTPIAGAAQGVTCGFGGGVVSITVHSPIGDVVLTRSGQGIVLFEGDVPVSCGTPGPTVSTADSVRLTDLTDGSIEFVLDLTGGRLEPGSTTEGAGQSEIEVTADLGEGLHDTVRVLGTGGPDVIEIGPGGIDLNDDVDADDLVTSNAEEHAAFGGNGADSIDGGGAAPGQGFPGKLSLSGGDDGDILIGGALGDTLEGGPDGDALTGGDGPDDLFGNGNADDLDGGNGSDRLDGGDGADTEVGGDGDDSFDQGVSSNGGDSMDGGAGTRDVVAYDRRSVGVNASPNGIPDDGQAGELDDIAADVEGLLGGAGPDDLAGGAAANFFEGGPSADDIDGAGGADSVTGGPGEDDLAGGAGDDIVNYFAAPGGMAVNLAAGAATGVHGPDTLAGFEDAGGSAHPDVLTGDGGPNGLVGRGGGDVLAGLGGSDELFGSAGRDVADYTSAPGPIVADLAAGSVEGQGTDSLSSVEGLVGGSFADVLLGGRAPNPLTGGDGADRLGGREGDDRMKGGPGADLLRGGTEADQLDGDGGNDDLRGQAGSDDLDGGPGRDRCLQGPGVGTEVRCET
jgi:Ca2+-binding RTX toxin-like protein